jgi:hypothetical protein
MFATMFPAKRIELPFTSLSRKLGRSDDIGIIYDEKSVIWAKTFRAALRKNLRSKHFQAKWARRACQAPVESTLGGPLPGIQQGEAG